MHTKSMVAGGVAGAITVVLAWLLSEYASVTAPDAVVVAIQIIIQALVHEKFPEGTDAKS